MKNTMKARHSDHKKAEVLALVNVVGQREAARQTGVPLGTIATWVRRAGLRSPETNALPIVPPAAQTSWADRSTRLVDQLGLAAELAVARLIELIAADRVNPDTLVKSIAALIANAQLLSGGATARTEQLVERTPELEAEIAKVLEFEVAQAA